MIVHRTIFKELLINVTVIILSLSVILFMEKFVRITRLFMGKGAELLDVFKIFVYLQPSILLLSVPMALLIAIFLTYGRMSTDSEITVLKACGMNFFGITKAALFLSVVCCIFLLWVSLYLSPRGMAAFKRTLYDTIVRKASMTLEEGTFSDVFKGNIIYVKEVTSRDEFRGIFVYRDADKTVPDPVTIIAENGKITTKPEEGQIKLTMQKGMIHTYSRKNSSELTFSLYELVLSVGMEAVEKIKPDEIKTMRLWNGRNGTVSWAIELHRRMALPFVCIIFALLGPSLASRMGKAGRLGGFSLSLSILILYYVLLIIGETFAKTGKLTPFWGAWAPNIFFGTIAALFFYRAYQDKPIKRF